MVEVYIIWFELCLRRKGNKYVGVQAYIVSDTEDHPSGDSDKSWSKPSVLPVLSEPFLNNLGGDSSLKVPLCFITVYTIPPLGAKSSFGIGVCPVAYV